MNRIINKEFIEHIRINNCITNWLFDKSNTNEIVPKELKHENLIRNFSIDESIIKFYFFATRDLLTDEEFKRMKESGYIGEKETTLYPYSDVIFGAYYLKTDLLAKLSGIVFSKRNDYTINGVNVESFNDLEPYFKEYARGFQDGFNEFDNNQIKPFLTMFAEKKDYLNKVFEFLTKRVFLRHGWGAFSTGFTQRMENIEDRTEGEIVDAFENGQKQGCFYRAWCIVFSSSELFAPLFKDYYMPDSYQQDDQPRKTKYFAKHYVLAYLFECNAKGQALPIGRKKELERVGNERMGIGKGNRFYKVFNEIINIDMNSKERLVEIGGEDWRKAVLELSNDSELVESYLQNKQL